LAEVGVTAPLEERDSSGSLPESRFDLSPLPIHIKEKYHD
jgi:hypothetical protein